MQKHGNQLHSRGFTLVELMVVAGLLGGLALVMMNISKQSTKSSTKLQFDTDISITTSEINGILSDPAICLATFGSSVSPTNINAKYFTIASGSAPTGGYGNSGLQITSYTLTGTSPDGVLTIAYQNKNILKGTTGPTTVSKKIDINFQGVLGSVTACKSLSTSSTNIWSLGNGTDIYYSGGNVGVGTNAPVAKLDVAGEIRPGSSGVTIGSVCLNEGSFAYDIGAHAPVYCNNDSPTKHWAPMGGGLGVNQTWQNMTASRANNTNYTNTSGKPIQVSVNCLINAGAGATSNFYVDGLIIESTILQGAQNNAAAVGKIVPNGSTYKAYCQFGRSSWFELR